MRVPIVVNGRSGRMSDLVSCAVRDAPDLILRGRLSRRPGPGEDSGAPVRPDLSAWACEAPVVIDFTWPHRTGELLTEAVATPCALVIGTSGLEDAHRELLAAVARDRAVLISANFSLGLRSVRRFVRDLAGSVGSDWGAGIVDLHFRGKKDALSATARTLAQDWDGHRGPGAAMAVPAAFRQGDGVSEHRVLAGGFGEVVEVVHRIDDRRAFLPGILAAARFVHRREPGLYSLEHVA